MAFSRTRVYLHHADRTVSEQAKSKFIYFIFQIHRGEANALISRTDHLNAAERRVSLQDTAILEAVAGAILVAAAEAIPVVVVRAIPVAAWASEQDLRPTGYVGVHCLAVPWAHRCR